MSGAAERQVVISGIGQSEIARPSKKSALRLTVEACLSAIHDAGLVVDDIDGLATWPGRTDTDPGFGPIGISDVKEALGLRLNFFFGWQGKPGPTRSHVQCHRCHCRGLRTPRNRLPHCS